MPIAGISNKGYERFKGQISLNSFSDLDYTLRAKMQKDTKRKPGSFEPGMNAMFY